MKNKHYFGEWVKLENESELKEATQYLALWTKYFQRRVPELKFIDSHLIYKPKGTYSDKELATVGVKIVMEGEKPNNVLSLDQFSV
jgi:hypothetical protein